MEEKKVDFLTGIKEKISETYNNYVTRKETMGLLKDIDEKYYEQIFKFLNCIVVIGDKKKFNTLEYFENEVMTADVKKIKALGFPENDIEKAHLIKGILIRFVELSKDIRRDQWKTASNPTKKGDFEARKHSTPEAIVDRNQRLASLLHINPKTAEKYGFALTLEELENSNKPSEDKLKELITKAKKDDAFNKFYEDFKKIYKLGDPTSESDDVLYKVFEDLNQNQENNSFGLKGVSLKAAKKLVEETIMTRRNTHQKGVEASKELIEEKQEELGM